VSTVRKDHKKNPHKGRKNTTPVATIKSEIPTSFWWEKRPWLPALIILLLTFVAFLPMLQNGFTNWDDPVYVTENALIKDLSGDGIKEIFSTPVSSLYHPLTILSLAFNYAASELKPFSYTFTNLILHLFNTFLVFFFIYRLTDKKVIPAIVVSLFFGIHPMHVESVAWISERKDLLYTFFLLGALIAYLKYNAKPGLLPYLTVTLLFLLSLLSKPSAIIFPALLILIDFYQSKPFTIRKYIVEKIPFGLLALAMVFVTLQLQSVQNIEEARFSSFEGLLFGFYGFIIYIIKLFVPYGLSAFHPYPENTSLSGLFYLAPVFSLIILYLAYHFRKNRTLLFGLGFFFVAVLPNLKFLPYGNSLMAERYTYVSYIGLLFIIGIFIHNILYKKIPTKAGKPLAVLIILLAATAFTIQTHERTKIWNNSKVLWIDVVEKYPDSYRANMSLGGIFLAEDNYPQALEFLNHSLEFNPTYTHSLEYRGICYVKMQEYEKALPDLEQWAADEPDNMQVYIYLAEVHKGLDNPEKAISALDKAIELNPDNFTAFNNRGTIYFNKLKDYNKALEDFNKVIELNPTYGRAYANRANCYLMLGYYDKARESAQHAIGLGVKIPDTFFDYLK
jgi:tetratricopeptide (TPR) repeat protein